MKELKKFSSYLKKNHLLEISKENLRLAKKMKVPLMKHPFIVSLSNEELVKSGVVSMEKFLASIENDSALKNAKESLKRWEEDKIPGFSKYDIQPSDLVLIYAAQKKAILKFLPLYTNDFKKGITIINELEDYYTEVKNDAVQMLYKIQKGMEEQLKVNGEELIRSNKELEQFAYVASHDLQEPLRMITSYVQLLAKRYKDKLDDDANDFIAYAVDGSNRMRVLINSLLEYSRINRIQPFEKINLTKLLQNVLDDLKDSIQESNTVIKTGKLPAIYGDTVLIGQLFQNLIANAIKFKRTQPLEIIIKCKKQSGEYLFSVEDNGIGIQQAYKEKIFIIFQRLHSKEKYSGTGIGLAICKKIVERHGGKIWVESKMGVGSTFYFSIKK